MLHLRAKVRQQMAKKSEGGTEQSEKDLLGEAVKELVLKTRSIKDIFDYFFRSRS